MTCRKLYEVALFTGGIDKSLIHYLNTPFEDPFLGPGLHKRYITFKPHELFLSYKGQHRQMLVYIVNEVEWEMLEFIKSEYIDNNRPVPGF